MSRLMTLRGRFSAWNRQRKLRWIVAHLPNKDSIIDVGASPGRHREAGAPNANATLAQPISWLDILGQRPLGSPANYVTDYLDATGRAFSVLGLASENWSGFATSYPTGRLYTFDGVHFPHFDEPFDLAISTAVLEHVGDKPQQQAWLKGLRAICDRLIITTPNRFFPLEAHTGLPFVHWFPRRWQPALLKLMRQDPGRFDGIWLLSRSEFESMLKRAGFSVIETRASRVLGFAADFAILAR